MSTGEIRLVEEAGHMFLENFLRLELHKMAKSMLLTEIDKKIYIHIYMYNLYIYKLIYIYI